MPIDQQIGQLFILELTLDLAPHEIGKLIAQTHLGNIMFNVNSFNHHSMSQTKEKISTLESFCQKYNGLIPFIVTSYEGGYSLEQQIPLTTFPSAQALAKINDPIIIYSIGQLIALELNFLGIHLNLAPTVDLNLNPMRNTLHSFSTDPSVVSNLAKEFIHGQSHYNVFSSIKSFPGKGSIKYTHDDRLISENSISQAFDSEWIPYQSLRNDAGAILLSDALIPNIDPDHSSLFSKKLNRLLRNRIGFEKLLITEPLTQSMAFKNSHPKTLKQLTSILSQLAIDSFLTGSDLIQIGQITLNNEPLSKEQLDQLLHSLFYNFKAKVAQGVISKEKIEASTRRVLMAKIEAYRAHQVRLTSKELQSILKRNHQFSYTLSRLAIDLSATKPYKPPKASDPVLIFIPKPLENKTADLIKDYDRNITPFFYDTATILNALQIIKNERSTNPKVIVTVDDYYSKEMGLRLHEAAEGLGVDVTVANIGTDIIGAEAQGACVFTTYDQSPLATKALFDILFE